MAEKTAKIRRTLILQTKLNEKHHIRPILTIPNTTLGRVNSPDLRRFWEIWIIARRGDIMHKIPKKGGNRLARTLTSPRVPPVYVATLSPVPHVPPVSATNQVY